jgi:hypothetical protein
MSDRTPTTRHHQQHPEPQPTNQPTNTRHPYTLYIYYIGRAAHLKSTPKPTPKPPAANKEHPAAQLLHQNEPKRAESLAKIEQKQEKTKIFKLFRKIFAKMFGSFQTLL